MSGQYQSLANKITAPKAGEISVTNTNTTAANLSLGNIGTATANTYASAQQGGPPWCVNRYVRFTANGTAVGVVFGPNVGAVTNANAPNTANVGLATSATAAPGAKQQPRRQRPRPLASLRHTCGRG